MADLLVQNAALVELEAVKVLDNIHIVQCLNYLTATGFKVCLLLNFGMPKVQIRRLIN
jgi:GxxExxY protein